MARVLIGFGEALPAPEVVFSLLSAGHRVAAFARGNHPLARILPDWHRITPPEEDTAQAIADLRALMAGDGAADLILPLDDAALWLVDAALGSDTRVVGATGDRAAFALDKERQIETARAAGLSVLPTTIVASPADLPALPSGPAIAKPRFAIREQDGRLGKPSAHYLLAAQDRDRLARSLSDGPFLVQPSSTEPARAFSAPCTRAGSRPGRPTAACA